MNWAHAELKQYVMLLDKQKVRRPCDL